MPREVVPMEVRPKRMKPPAGERPLFQGSADEVVKDIKTYADLGVTHLVWDPTHQDLPSVLDNLKRFAQDVAPRFNRSASRRGSAPAVNRRASKGGGKKTR